jgi:hypothetical protein
MISLVGSGVARFVADPVGSLMAMRQATPPLRASVMALVACMLCMVVIDFIWGPLAVPQSLEPGGKRSGSVFGVAAVEIVRIFGVAAVVWLGMRLWLGKGIGPAEACWMTVPYALALVGFEILQASAWLLFVATQLNLYGQTVVIGFGAAMLVMTVSVRALAPDRDWLSCLPVVICAVIFGTFFPLFALGVAACLLVLDRLRGRH